jgi:hypothetical protein
VAQDCYVFECGQPVADLTCVTTVIKRLFRNLIFDIIAIVFIENLKAALW